MKNVVVSFFFYARRNQESAVGLGTGRSVNRPAVAATVAVASRQKKSLRSQKALSVPHGQEG